MSKNVKKEVSETADKDVQVQRGQTLSPFTDMEHMFDSFFDRSWPRSFMRPLTVDWGGMLAPFEGRTPKVDIINRDKEVLVKAELPGVKKEDVDVQVMGNSVIIRASTKHDTTEEKGEYHRRELSRGEFLRSLTLPAEVDSDKAKASFRDGMLELIMPKLVVAKRHSVNIE